MWTAQIHTDTYILYKCFPHIVHTYVHLCIVCRQTTCEICQAFCCYVGFLSAKPIKSTNCALGRALWIERNRGLNGNSDHQQQQMDWMHVVQCLMDAIYGCVWGWGFVRVIIPRIDGTCARQLKMLSQLIKKMGLCWRTTRFSGSRSESSGYLAAPPYR